MPINGVQASAGKKPATPTIGTATDGGTGTTVSVAFTPSSYIGKGTITYTATSNPGSITATGSGSPITVSSLTAGTAYTFTVKGDTNYGVASDTSSASNSVTPALPTAFDSIATINPNGANTLTFSNIPQTYKALQIRGVVFAPINNGYSIRVEINGVTSSYAYSMLKAQDSSVTSTGSSNDTILAIDAGESQPDGGNWPSPIIINLLDYTSSSKRPTIRSITGNNKSASGGIAYSSGLSWNALGPVTSIRLYSNNGVAISSPSTFALYGVK